MSFEGRPLALALASRRCVSDVADCKGFRVADDWAAAARCSVPNRCRRVVWRGRWAGVTLRSAARCGVMLMEASALSASTLAGRV